MNHYRNENNNIAVNWGLVMKTAKATKVYPTDVDGMLERNGRFLFLEWKHESVTEIPRGQLIAYTKLDAINGVTVAFVFGDYATWKVSAIQWINKPRMECDNETLVQWMRDWWRYATQNPIRRN